MAEPRPHNPRRSGGSDESIKETFESLVVAFVLAFIFRAFVVEAFIIPTGSMAPTLLGAHLDISCEQCGYRFPTDLPDHSLHGDGEARVALELQLNATATCPMCTYTIELPAGTEPASGDRILVQKYVYDFMEPRRWDVVVFKAPHTPETNYIKRLVGMPNEAVRFLDGNVYVHPLNEAGQLAGDGDRWRIARKTDRPSVQRAVFRPIYHSQYVPLDEGQQVLGEREHAWSTPWVPQGETAVAWDVENRRHYRYESESPGELVFDFEAGNDGQFASMHPYAQFDTRRPVPEPVENLRLAALVRPDAEGLELVLSATGRLHDAAGTVDASVGAERLMARITGEGDVVLEAEPIEGEGERREIARTAGRPLSASRATEVELWHVDQEASVWIDGRRVLRHRFDPSMETLLERPAAEELPKLRIEVSGSAVTLSQVELDRDLYYSGRDPRGADARGAVNRSGNRTVETRPFPLYEDEFFTVGDNGPFSNDSRYWHRVHPWVEEEVFPGEARPGVVHRDVLMGRAFFVYFPGPHALHETSRRLIPNFGDMRFIR